MNPEGEGAVSPYRRLRLIVWLVAAALAIVNFMREGLDLSAVALVVVLVTLGLAAQLVETRLQRPLKNYLRVVLGSLALALVFIAMPLAMGVNILIGVILWTGVSAALLIWCIHYERTEPL